MKMIILVWIRTGPGPYIHSGLVVLCSSCPADTDLRPRLMTFSALKGCLRGDAIIKCYNAQLRTTIASESSRKLHFKDHTLTPTETNFNDEAFSLGVEIRCADRTCVPDDVRLW